MGSFFIILNTKFSRYPINRLYESDQVYLLID
jgi:hypothetical protein